MNEKAGYLSGSFMPKCTVEEAWVLAMTMDNCIVPRKSAAVAARHLRSFLAGPGQLSTAANHWPAILKVLEAMPEEYTGIGINHTSVMDCALMGEYGEDEDDEEEGEWREYDVNVDKEHFFLTEECIRKWRKAK